MSNAATPSKPAHLIEQERKMELLRRVKGIREGLLLNRGAVLTGDPSKEYCWVNKDQDRRIYFEQMGWELCVVDPNKPSVTTNWKPQQDGTIARGDLILYQIDKDLYEATEAYNVIRGLELTENAGSDFEGMMERMKVPTYKPKV